MAEYLREELVEYVYECVWSDVDDDYFPDIFDVLEVDYVKKYFTTQFEDITLEELVKCIRLYFICRGLKRFPQDYNV